MENKRIPWLTLYLCHGKEPLFFNGEYAETAFQQLMADTPRPMLFLNTDIPMKRNIHIYTKYIIRFETNIGME